MHINHKKGGCISWPIFAFVHKCTSRAHLPTKDYLPACHVSPRNGGCIWWPTFCISSQIQCTYQESVVCMFSTPYKRTKQICTQQGPSLEWKISLNKIWSIENISLQWLSWRFQPSWGEAILEISKVNNTYRYNNHPHRPRFWDFQYLFHT